MKIQYKGFEIDVYKEMCMAGYKLTYWNVLRLRDGWLMIDGYSEDNVRWMVRHLKGKVDEYLKNSSQWKEEN